MKKLIITLLLISISGCAYGHNQNKPSHTESPVITEAPQPQAENIQIMPLDAPTPNNLTLVTSVDASLKSNTSMDTISLYTSAKKSGGKFQWDDHAQWVLELVTEDGEIYELYNTMVSNGAIYFDIAEVDGKAYIFLKNISTAADYTKVYAFTDGKLFETNELNLNEMKNKVINLIYTSIPKYR